MSPIIKILTIGTLLSVATPAAAAGFDHSHGLWTELLGKYVRNGEVAYGELHKRDRRGLQAYLGELEAVTAADYGAFSSDQKLAFWLNAYNAYTIELILRHYPIKSIRKIGILPLAAFRENFIPLRAVGDDELSLNDIENEIIRPKFPEVRIHFALVCASTSCPVLRPEAFRAANLDAQLDDQAKTFINDTTKNRFDPKSGTLYLSSIFKWFDGDFVKYDKGVLPFVSRHLNDGAKPGDAPKIEFLDYDWSLNGK